MSATDQLRFLAQLNRSDGPRSAGGEITPRPADSDSVPYRLSEGYAIVSGQVAGVDHDGPVVVQGDNWWLLDRDDRPEWMTEATWDRIKGENR